MGEELDTQNLLIVKEKDYEFYEHSRKVPGVKSDLNLLGLDPRTLHQILSKKTKKNNRKFNAFQNKKKPLTLGAQRLLENAQKKYTAVKSQNQKNNPLAASNFSTKSSLKSNVSNPLDPLSAKKPKNDPLSRQFNPLASNIKREPTKKKENQSLLQDKPKKNEDLSSQLSQIRQNDDEDLDEENNKKQTHSTEETNEGIEREDLWKEIKDEFVKIFGIRPNSSKMQQLVVNPFGSAAIKFEDKQFHKIAQSGEMKKEYGNAPQTQPGQKELHKITVKNYLSHLEERYSKMVNRWNAGDKVGALQVTIQQIKLLIENENPRFAPIKYVYVMDILDKFGSNIIERVKGLAFPDKYEADLRQMKYTDIKGQNISEQTQEVARNWVKKVGSIRELLPRMYLEIALLPIYYFIDSSKIPIIIQRLSKMTRAIGDYINCIYFSTYLLKVCADLLPREKSHILSLIQDFFFYMKQGPKFFGKTNISSEEYLELFQPFLVTAFKYYCNQCSDVQFYELFESFQNSNQHFRILELIIDIFPPQYIGQYAGLIFQIIQNYHADVKAIIYVKFLPKIAQAVSNPTTLQQICRLLWLDLAEINNLTTFLNILACLIEIVQNAFEGYQKMQFFSEILDKFNQLFTKSKESQNSVDVEILGKLEKFLIDILEGADNVCEIITIDPFIQFLLFFPNDIRPKVCVNVLDIFLKKQDAQEKIEDPVVVHSLISIGKHVNFALALTTEYKKSLIKILNIIINKVDFGRDLEQMLNLFTELRANFGNLNEITENLLYKVINLTLKVKVFSKGKVTPKVKAFLQACIAFGYITIPMITDIEKQIQFFTLFSQVALNHNLISQAEAIFKSGLQELLNVPEQFDGKNLDQALQNQMKNMISFMIVLPDDPEHDYLHLFQGFQKLTQVFKWSSKNGELYKLGLLCDLLKYLCIQIQERLPYHIEGVNSNDQLFVEPEFKKAILDAIQENLVEILQTQKQILSRPGFSNDVYTSINVIKQSLEVIHTLLQYFKANNLKIKEIIRESLELAQVKSQLLSQDKIGKIQFRSIHSVIKNTFATIEKIVGIEVSQDYEIVKNSIERNMEISKQNIF